MGVHYVNGGYAGDSVIEVDKPEALMYEMRNGRLQLLGVEYIVNVEAWHAHNDQPPTLRDRCSRTTAVPNRYGLDPFYELHVWAWRDNPNGAFVDWNPNVSCEAFTPAA